MALNAISTELTPAKTWPADFPPPELKPDIERSFTLIEKRKRQELYRKAVAARTPTTIILEANARKMNEQNGNSFRGSRFRGVTRNGHRWQVWAMYRGIKKYKGSFDDISEAAKMFDRVTIQH